MKRIGNITLKEFREFLRAKGYTRQRTKGGHEMWGGKPGTRTLTFQSHIEPIPTFIILRLLDEMGISKEEFLSIFE